MGSSRYHRPENPADQQVRDQEVLRANRELAAYFRGRRTEREARGALKIIKAFIRDRERTTPIKRRPLPVGAVGSGKPLQKPVPARRLRTRRSLSAPERATATSQSDGTAARPGAATVPFAKTDQPLLKKV